MKRGVCELAPTLRPANGGFCDVGHEVGQGGRLHASVLPSVFGMVTQITFSRAAAGLAFRTYFGRLP